MTSIDYKLKYLKYKSKYLNLLGGSCVNSSIEIGQDPIILEPKKDYIFTGLITCVGLLIKKVNFDQDTGNCNLITGIGIHFIDGTFFKNPNFTDQGLEILNDLKKILETWDVNDDIEIELITKPDMFHKEHDDSIAMKRALLQWFHSIQNWKKIEISNYTPLQINGKYNNYFKFST